MARKLVSIFVSVIVLVGGSMALAQAPAPVQIATRTLHSVPDQRDDLFAPTIVFRWGDISWLPVLALEAGWPVATHDRLGQIVLRESGGCPNRRGGDKVDKNCVITGVSEWNHRSDSGLLQINGVNYDPKRAPRAILCRELMICTQEPLLDPFLNLVAGKVLYDAAGWDPWDPCAWGPKFAERCKQRGWEP